MRKDKNKGVEEFDLFGMPLRVLFIFLLFVFLIAAVFASIMAVIMIPFGMYPYFVNPFWHIFGIIIGVLFLFWIFSWVFRPRFYVRRYRWNGFGTFNSSNAEEILKMRFARGEISKKEFEEMMHEIKR